MNDFFNKNKKEIIIAIIWLLCSTYILVVINYTTKFLPNTYIDGVNVSSDTLYIAENKLKENLLNNYELKIKTIDGETEQIDGKSIKIDADINVKELKLCQNNYLWFINFFKTNNYHSTHEINYNKEFLDKQIEELKAMKPENMVSPSNAKVSDYKYGKGYEIEKEKQGSTLIQENVKAVIKNAIKNSESEVDLFENNCYLNPIIKSDSKELIAELNEVNSLIQNKITYVYGDKKITLDPDIYHTWIIKENNRYVIDQSKIEEFVYSLDEIVTTYRKERVFITHDGREKIVNGPYGYELNIEEEIIQLTNDMNSKEDIVRTPVFSRIGAMKNGNDYGDTYVEIDLSNQKVFLFVEGKLIKHSDCVTGDMAKRHTTPPGIFGLTYKQRNAVLRGRGYASPVSYWMPFNGNIGLHDASWRSKFGGDIYKTDGSHGCINLPKDMAKTLYSNVYKGMPIICYY